MANVIRMEKAKTNKIFATFTQTDATRTSSSHGDSSFPPPDHVTYNQLLLSVCDRQLQIFHTKTEVTSYRRPGARRSL